MAKLKHLFSGRGRSTTSSESNTSSTGGNSVTIRPPPRSGSLKKRLSRLRRQQQELPSNEGDKQQQSSSSTEFFDPFGLDSDGFIDSTKNNNEERKNQSVDQSFDSFMDGDHNDMTFDLDDNENDFFLFSTTTNPDEWVTAKQVGPNRTKSGLLSSPSNQQRQKNNKSSGTGSGTVKESSHTATTVETSFDSGYPSMFSFITRRSQKSESPRRQQKQPKQTASATANSNKSPKEQKKQTIDILPTQDQEDSVYIFTDKYSSYDDDSHPAIGGGDVSTIGLSMKSDYSSLDSSSFWRNADNHSFHFQEHTIRVGLYERLSILFDGVTTDPTCRVVGFIYVDPTPLTEYQSSFYLTVTDRKNQVERWIEESDVCTNITHELLHVALDNHGDQVFRISLLAERPGGYENYFEAPIAAYQCVPKLKPIPILMKTKVQPNGDTKLRVGIRIRANPNNKEPVTNFCIIMAVPPAVNGEKAKMSRNGGHWDPMKRTIFWLIDKVLPSETIDIQVQFESEIQPSNDKTKSVDENDNNNNANTNVTSEQIATMLQSLKFPVMVRCDGTSLYSKVDIKSDKQDYEGDDQPPVSLQVQRSSRLLFRKV